MTVIIRYEAVSPAMLTVIVESKVPEMRCVARDIDGDCFELLICPWVSGLANWVAVEEALAPYV